MKPAFRVISSGNDITAQIADRLLSIRVTDEAGQKSDTVEITLDDRGQDLPLPAEQTELKVWLGYSHGNNSPQEMGAYVVDEVEFTYPPATVRVRGKAMEFSSTFKQPKTRSWHERTIGQIVAQIAGEHGLTPQVHSTYQARMIDHIDQTEESDAHFLTRLARLHGATAKPAEGMLVFIAQGAGVSVQGRQLPAARLTVQEVSSYRATVKDRGRYSKVEAKYLDKATGTEKKVEAPVPGASVPLFGEKPAVYQDRKLYPTQEEALEAAKAMGVQLTSGLTTIDLTCAGRPDIFAERPLELSGFRSQMNASWVIQSVTHELSSRGYSTKITCGTGGSATSNAST
jgi:phage protein D